MGKEKIRMVDLYGKPHMVSVDAIQHRVAGCGVLVHENKYLLIKDGGRSEKWELPGGGIDNGELLFSALRREFEEETGLKVDVGELVGFREGHFFHLATNTPFYTMRLFFLVSLIGDLADKTSGEFLGLDEINEDNTNILTLSILQEITKEKKYE